MNLQKKLDLIEAYRNSIKFLSHSSRGIEYTVIPGSKIKSGSVNIEVAHGREERTQR
ncbi:hypothetical protein PM001_03925 [[Clostridium] symbiosum]|uniref:hypothetical protein n=1 Tax=Clostridium symbiosum TaxID=1512 RepID=UPI0013149A70|nr:MULTISPECIES: hypothetical protein [Lachnospiraceae]MDB2035245.1 hypothetical protein [[Clostridium] symbiosum]QQQ98768.1 hypothetical protein I5Q83_21925 [Enterocloster clostridioformis]